MNTKNKRSLRILGLYAIGLICIVCYFLLENSNIIQELIEKLNKLKYNEFSAFFMSGLFKYGLLVVGIGIIIILSFLLIRERIKIQFNEKVAKRLILVIKVLAVLGFILSFLTLGGRTYRMGLLNPNNYAIIIGVIMILPLLIYLLLSKAKQKKVLKSNPIDLNKIGLTIIEYLDKKSKENFCEIYVKNETSDTLIINRESLLEPNSWYIFTTHKYRPIYFSNGIEFHIDKELNLEVFDYRNQIIGLGEDYFWKNDVPEYVDWAFIIAKPGQGDAFD